MVKPGDPSVSKSPSTRNWTRQRRRAGGRWGECCRESLLAGGQETKQARLSSAEAQVLMAELMELRAILLNVVYKLANGEKLTADEMQRLIDRADSDNLRKARERLAGPDAEGAIEEKS